MFFNSISVNDFGPPWAIALALVGAFILLSNAFIRVYTLKFPSNLPRVGDPGRNHFSLRSRLAYYIDCQRLYQEAYEQYSKKGKACLLPGIGLRSNVLLPSNAIKWMLSQPDDVLSATESFADVDQADYNLGHHKYVTDPWSGDLVRSEMNRSLENLARAMKDELWYAFDQRLGTDTEEWREIPVKKTTRLIVAQASSRFTVGLPLCRNEDYLRLTVRWTERFVINAALLQMIPKFLQPILGGLVTLPSRRTLSKIKQLFKPIYEERLRLFDSSEEKTPSFTDHFGVMIRASAKHRPEELRSLHDMTLRLLMANLASYHQTSATITNLILNVLASDAEYNTISVIREEVDRIAKPGRDSWTKANLAKMIRMDSIMRETLRLHAFGSRNLFRAVVVDGLCTEDGVALPKGAQVSVLSGPIARDDEYFPNPTKFDPFRFSRMRENRSNATEGDEKVENGATLSFVSTGHTYLPFGHGKHACPGRFIVDYEMKMILAYLFTHYDIEFPPEYEGKRPESKWVAEAMMPPEGAKIRVKRRAF